jgi:type I restriction enzyme S subunit
MLNRNYIAKLPITVPPLNDQFAITEVLGALDDKIAANSHVATTASLLQAAEFTRLMSGASVPGTIRDVLTLEYGKPLLAQNRTVGDVDVFGSGGIVGAHNEALSPGPGVVVGRKGTAGAVHWAPKDYYPIDTTFFVASSDIEICSMIFCYHLLKSVKLSEQNSDSAVPGLNRNDAHAIKIRLPDKESIQRFTLAAMPQANLAAQCDRESWVLAAIRDALLPQLMSGKLRVKDAQKSLAGVL